MKPEAPVTRTLSMDGLADRGELRSIRRGIEDLRRGRGLTKSRFLGRRPHLFS